MKEKSKKCSELIGLWRRVCKVMQLTCLLSVFFVYSSYAENFSSEKAVNSADEVKSVTIKGVVKDSKGITLPGVAVMLKGTTLGVVTDVDGNFTMTVPQQKGIVLTFTYMGMKPMEVAYTGQESMKVTMKEEDQELDEFVVTGYANVRKESYTGAVTTVKGEDLQKVANRNPIDALQVFDPSFRIHENNELGSNPNAIPDFYIRGQSSIDNFELGDASEAALRSIAVSAGSVPR